MLVLLHPLLLAPLQLGVRTRFRGLANRMAHITPLTTCKKRPIRLAQAFNIRKTCLQTFMSALSALYIHPVDLRVFFHIGRYSGSIYIYQLGMR